MGIKILGVDIAKEVHKAMSKDLLAATLTKTTLGDRTSGSLTSGKELTPTDYTARGFIDDYDDKRIDGTIVQKGDRLITLIGDSIASSVVPSVNDSITIEGQAYTIIRVKRDPAAAVYECQSR